jgi:hypothetical protein
MRDLKRDMRERLTLEHNWNSATADGNSQDGKHKEISITPAGAGANPILKTNANQSLTGSQATNGVELGITWNTTGNPVALKLNLTNTASGSSAKLIDLVIGATPTWWVDKTGYTRVPNGALATPSIASKDDTNTGLVWGGLDDFTIAANGISVANFTDNNFFGAPQLSVTTGAFGTGSVTGCGVVIGRNTSGNGAPGVLQLVDKSGGGSLFWADTGGLLRTGSAPTEAVGDTTGTVVGTQTSSLDAKTVRGRVTDLYELLDEVLRVPLFRFTYKNGSFNGEEFLGLITDHSPTFGMDVDEAHPAGKSLNVVTAIGHLIASVQVLHARLAALEVTT